LIRIEQSIEFIPYYRRVTGCLKRLLRVRQSLRSSPITGDSSLLRTDPPLIPGIGTLRLTLKRAYIVLPWHPGFSFPCSVTEPGIKSCHLYAGCPSCLLAGGSFRILMTGLLGSQTPRILSNNKVSYDASTMDYSHLVHLFIPHLTKSCL